MYFFLFPTLIPSVTLIFWHHDYDDDYEVFPSLLVRKAVGFYFEEKNRKLNRAEMTWRSMRVSSLFQYVSTFSAVILAVHLHSVWIETASVTPVKVHVGNNLLGSVLVPLMELNGGS